MKDRASTDRPLAAPLLAGAAMAAIAVFGLVKLAARADLPPQHLARTIVALDGAAVRGPSDIRFVLSRKAIGDPVEIRFAPGGPGPDVVNDVVVPFYARRSFPLPLVLLGGVSFLAGFAVLLFRPRDRRARIFYWLSVCFGATVVIGGGTYGLQGRTVHLLPGLLFNIAYPLTLAFLVRFAWSYGPSRPSRRLALFWAVPAGLGVAMASLFLAAELLPSLEAYRLREVLKHGLRIYVVAMGVYALAEFGRALKTTPSEEDRVEIRGYLVALALGLGPFLAFNQLPLALSGRPLLPEEFSLVFFLMVPIFMTMAILQFRLLRVNIVFHRGHVYAILTFFTLGLFLLLVEGLKLAFPRATATGNVVLTMAAAVLIAVLLSPGRRRIQDAVDQLFFRQAYDYRRALQAFKAAAPSVVEAGRLADLFAKTLAGTLRVSRTGLLLDGGEGRTGELDERAAAALAGLPRDAVRPWARAAAVRDARDLDLSRDEALAAAGADLVLPLPPAAGAPSGLVVVGPKSSGHRLTGEDIDFAAALAGELAVNLGRIRIQEEMIYEKASREKTEELVRLKTEFIASVSHELRTPMTSLRGLSDLLRSGKVDDPAKRERLLGLMAGECGRLGRFLTNVLDYGRIEAGARAYDLRPTDLAVVVREVVDLVRESQAEGEARVRLDAPAGPVMVRADADAVRQALLNLIDNALKYSPDGADVVVRLAAGPEAATLAVEDRGIGLEPGDRERIFEPFVRCEGAAARAPSGVGLGLRIVRHIMDAHGGRAEVESEPGRGSVFRLVFSGGPAERATSR